MFYIIDMFLIKALCAGTSIPIKIFLMRVDRKLYLTKSTHTAIFDITLYTICMHIATDWQPSFFAFHSSKYQRIGIVENLLRTVSINFDALIMTLKKIQKVWFDIVSSFMYWLLIRVILRDFTALFSRQILGKNYKTICSWRP